MINKYNFARFSLIPLFAIVTLLQLFSLPGQFAHMRRESGISLIIEIALTITFASLIVCAQLSIYSLWRLIGHMQANTFHSPSSYLRMNRLVAYLRAAIAFPVILILIIAPQADDPGVLVLLTAILLFLVNLYLFSSLLRDQIQRNPAQ
jgi:hypothetical protein